MKVASIISMVCSLMVVKPTFITSSSNSNSFCKSATVSSNVSTSLLRRASKSAFTLASDSLSERSDFLSASAFALRCLLASDRLFLLRRLPPPSGNERDDPVFAPLSMDAASAALATASSFRRTSDASFSHCPSSLSMARIASSADPHSWASRMKMGETRLSTRDGAHTCLAMASRSRKGKYAASWRDPPSGDFNEVRLSPIPSPMPPLPSECPSRSTPSSTPSLPRTDRRRVLRQMFIAVTRTKESCSLEQK
mmetsp:Transcript_51877/g.155694  ORF Transcript_51877/g.155694 Transcript_51877/m.155694 type:complete len:253 (+) Transcript_51877:2531-3289(+)